MTGRNVQRVVDESGLLLLPCIILLTLILMWSLISNEVKCT